MSIQGRAKVLQRSVDDWNVKHPAGTRVRVTLDRGFGMADDVTAGAAVMLGGHTPCVKLAGRGMYLLSRCRPIGGPELVAAGAEEQHQDPERWDGLS